jgi:hypothetical protein
VQYLLKRGKSDCHFPFLAPSSTHLVSFINIIRSFVALFCYRLDIFPKWQSLLFYAAAIQALVLKMAVTLVCLVYYSIVIFKTKELDNQQSQWKWFWKIMFVPMLILLFASQLYAIRILRFLGLQCQKRLDDSYSNTDDRSDANKIHRCDVDEASAPTAIHQKSNPV